VQTLFQPTLQGKSKTAPAKAAVSDMQSLLQPTLQCKVCDRGVLVRKKTFRMSGPVVAIGYILLVPSILGMIACGLVLFRFISLGSSRSTVGTEALQSSPESHDAAFRRSCVNAITPDSQNYSTAPTLPLVRSELEVAKVCECALSEVKETNSESAAIDLCWQKLSNNILLAPSDDIQQFYAIVIRGSEKQAPESNSTPEPEPSAALGLVSMLGGGIALGFGVAFFVAGLLGWLLIMRKRVLQCSVCGAVINAS